MTGQKSKDALLAFLDYLARKGLMNKTTVSSRKAAVNNVLGILDVEEAKDVSMIDLDNVMHRFQNLNGMKYTGDSLSTYKSRVRSAIDDFLSYIENPMAFKPSTGSGKKTRESSRAANRAQKENTTTFASAPTLIAQTPPPVATLILPIPVRADLTVYVQGIPHDLTQSEASRIANVIRAMAIVD